VWNSITNESMCSGSGPTPPHPFPPNPVPSSNCTFVAHRAQNAIDIAYGHVDSLEECCGACLAMPDCHGADYVEATAMHPTFTGSATGGTCHIKASYDPKPEVKGENQTAIRPGA
jgi:hypothetical protein